MSLVQIHHALANACLIFSLLISGVAFYTYFRKLKVTANLWGMLAAGEVLYLVQALLGLALVIVGGNPARGWVHFLYGALITIVLPGAFSFTRGRDTAREALIYAILGLFLAGVSLRATGTALQALPGA
jgi:heme A synthase